MSFLDNYKCNFSCGLPKTRVRGYVVVCLYFDAIGETAQV